MIQLKKAGHGLSFESELANAHPIAHIIAHEIIRASGKVDDQNKSPDDGFQLTILKYHLDTIKTSDLRTPNAGLVLRPKILHYAWKNEIFANGDYIINGVRQERNNEAMNSDENLDLDKAEAQAFVEHVMSQKYPDWFFSTFRGFMHRAGKDVFMGHSCFYNFRPNWGLKKLGAMALADEFASFDQMEFRQTEAKLYKFEDALAHAWKYVSQNGKLTPNPLPNLGYEQAAALDYATKIAELKTPVATLLSGDDEAYGTCQSMGLYSN